MNVRAICDLPARPGVPGGFQEDLEKRDQRSADLSPKEGKRESEATWLLQELDGPGRRGFERNHTSEGGYESPHSEEEAKRRD